MRHSLLLLASVLLVLAACHSDAPTEPQPAEAMGTVAFEVVNYEQYSLDDVTRASATDLAHLDMAIYDKTSGQLVALTQQVPGDDAYGTFSATLPYGDYNVVFLGYQGSRTANMEAATSISFDGNYVPNLFHKCISLTIDKASQTAQNVSLNRRVAAFALNIEDTAPATLASLAFACQGGGHRLNGLTGYADQAEERTYAFNLTTYAGQSEFTVTIFSFLTSDEAAMDFGVTAYDADGGTIRSRDFFDVPMKLNRLTRYSGKFFAEPQGTQGFRLSVENPSWEEEDYTY